MVKITINDVKAKKSYKKELESNPYLNRKLREKVSGDEIGLRGYELLITGGSDKEGFPMRSDIQGIGRKKTFIVSGVGAKRTEKGVRSRVHVHGNTIDENIMQLNLKIEKYGKDTVPKLLGLEKEVSEEKTENKDETQPK